MFQYANTAALAAKYTNFEIICVADDFNMSLFQSATGTVNARHQKQSLNDSRTQAANVKVLGDQTTACDICTCRFKWNWLRSFNYYRNRFN